MGASPPLRRLALLVALASVVEAASLGEPAPGVVGAKKLATAVDCNGAVAFSSKGAAAREGEGKGAEGKGAEGKLHFAVDLTDKSVGWSRHTGEFTTFCPGLYQFAFSSGGDPKAKLSLRRRVASGAWEPVVGAAAGGANVVLLNMEVGDSAALFLDSPGALDADAGPSATFSGFRVAKKTP